MMMYQIFLFTIAGVFAGGLIPLTFDARSNWAQCATITVVQDQGCCAASYAIAATAVMSDRTCILSNATSPRIRQYSAYDVLNCCLDCSTVSCPNHVTNEVAIWKYWIKVGIASEDCLPYSYRMSCLQRQICPLLCEPRKGGLVAHDRIKGRSIYEVFPTVLHIQMEILAYGPVLSTIQMYTNFLVYDGGVYSQTVGQYLGQQSVRIIGWGHEGQVDYWLCVNSFGIQWGANGTFKIIRGSDYLGIESNVRTGLPQT